MPKHKASRRPFTMAAGAALIVLAFLVSVGLFPHQTAPVPRFVAVRGGQAFGLGLWGLPVLCLLVGLIALVRRTFALSARVWGLIAGYAVALVALHLQYPAGRELLAASGRKGGGYVGAVVSLALRRLAGEPGLWLATAGGGAAVVVLVWGLSLEQLGQMGQTAFLWISRTAAIAGREFVAGAGRIARLLGTAIARMLVMTLTGLRELGRRLWRAALCVLHVARSLSLPTAVMPAKPVEAGSLGGEPANRVAGLADVAHGSADPGTADALAVAAAPGPAEDSPDAFEGAARDAAPGDAAASSAAPPSKRPKRRRAETAQESLPLPIEPRRAYTVPDLSLLDAYAAKAKSGKVDPEEVARHLERTLSSFGVDAKVIRWETGPVVTRYELQPAPGVKVQKITSLQNDIALSLAASSVRLEAPIPGKSAIGVELPNERPSLVHLREILASDDFVRASSPLAVAVGKGIAGTPVVADLVQMPHLLIAGATGAGKSVALNAMIASILFRSTPEQARFLMIDPKRVELTNYNGIPHLLSPVVTGPREAAAKLRWAIQEMESRYEMFASDGVRNIQAFNASHPDRPLAYILIIIDELADLMMVAPADFEEIICRLAQMTRATGIHLLVATQRPSVDVITGLIKANIPSRIAFSVSSQVDSRTILDHPGAEKLLGRGDMLFAPLGATRPLRVQGAFIGDAETERLVQFWRAQGEPAYVDALLRATVEETAEDAASGADALLGDAARLVVRAGYASVSLLQRKMRIGYVRAARLVDQLEERGIVGPSQGSSPRDLLVGLDELERVLRAGSAQPARAAAGADDAP
ncbi:MAG TPA: DNA translocase FtsK [bacterium]|nr:DNA translocase FtsK [bacterium]